MGSGTGRGRKVTTYTSETAVDPTDRLPRQDFASGEAEGEDVAGGAVEVDAREASGVGAHHRQTGEDILGAAAGGTNGAGNPPRIVWQFGAWNGG